MIILALALLALGLMSMGYAVSPAPAGRVRHGFVWFMIGLALWLGGTYIMFHYVA